MFFKDRDDVLMSDKIDGVVAHFIAHNKVCSKNLKLSEINYIICFSLVPFNFEFLLI